MPKQAEECTPAQAQAQRHSLTRMHAQTQAGPQPQAHTHARTHVQTQNLAEDDHVTRAGVDDKARDLWLACVAAPAQLHVHHIVFAVRGGVHRHGPVEAPKLFGRSGQNLRRVNLGENVRALRVRDIWATQALGRQALLRALRIVPHIPARC